MPRLPPLDGSEVRSALAPSPNGGGRSSRVSSELNTEKPPKRSRSASRGIAIRAPAAGALVAGGVVPTLEVDATGATIDGREVAACYAVLDRKCCALLWTAPGPLRADDALPADAAPVFERLDLPPGDHELVAWLEHANGTLVAFDSVRFGVLGVVS